jgi:hypothetical protein
MKNMMKATLAAVNLLIVVSLLLAMASCGGGSPTAAVRAFMTALEKGDTKAMEKVATPETVALIAAFGEKATESMEEYGKITYGDEKIDGDKATVKVSFANGQSSDVDLIKVDGKWKVTTGK